MNKGIKWLIAVLAVFALATAAGAFCSVRTEPWLIYDYFAELSGGEISINTKGAVMSALAVWLVLFFSAFFKFGAAAVILTVTVRGFIDGYSIAAILRILGMKGLGLCFFDAVGVPLMLFMSANVMYILTAEEASGKAFLIRSMALLGIMLLAALVTALLSGTVLSGVLSGFDL